VVSGLDVTSGSPTEIVVHAGFAIDCAGNEIHIDAPVMLPIPGLTGPLFVAIGYAETLDFPATLATAMASVAPGEIAFTRIREGFQLAVVGIDPSLGHCDIGTGTPGCGDRHAVCIARMKAAAGGWRIEQRGRRRH
jgi:hypothetical protein